MKIIIAPEGKYIETLRQYAGKAVAVMPHGTPVITSADPFEELVQHPLGHRPTDLLESS
jgi:hypothetical protein